MESLIVKDYVSDKFSSTPRSANRLSITVRHQRVFEYDVKAYNETSFTTIAALGKNNVAGTKNGSGARDERNNHDE
ncbi:MAG TPA: hypothetical protein VIJ40_00640 [Acidimicrobiales bacterium]